jgi:hypothetical protein
VDIDLLFAASALVIADHLSLDLLHQAFVNSLEVFHDKRHVVEILDPILDLSALRADKLVAGLSSEK